MRYLLIIASTLLFICCTNKKVEIVEQQKKVKKELLKAKSEGVDLDYKSIKFRGKMGEWQGLHKSTNIPIEMKKTYDSITDAEIKLNNKIVLFQSQYDSLEMELKKY